MNTNATLSPKQIIKKETTIHHILKSTDNEFTSFGEVYTTTLEPNKPRGWYQNKTTTVHYKVIVGEVKVVLTEGDHIDVVVLNPESGMLTVPPGVHRGFCAQNTQAILLDIMSAPFDEADLNRSPPETFSQWNEFS